MAIEVSCYTRYCSIRAYREKVKYQEKVIKSKYECLNGVNPLSQMALLVVIIVMLKFECS